MRSTGTLLCVGSAAGFGAMAVFGKLAYDNGATVGTLLAVRFALAAALFWALVVAEGSTRELRSVGRRDIALALALGAAGYAAQAGCFFAALDRIDASLLSLVLYTFPGMVAVAAIVLGRERAEPARVRALGLASGGLVLVLASAKAGSLDPVGTALAVTAAVIYTTYILVSEGIAGRLRPSLLSALVCTGAAVALTLGSAALGDLHLFEWESPVWEHDLDNGLRLLRLALDTHLITSHHALPKLRPGGLVVEVTDGTAEYNATHFRVNLFYDLAKTAVTRMAWALAQELGEDRTAVALTPGWLRSETMLAHHGVTEANWRESPVPHFCISESPRFVGRAVAALSADPDLHRWSGQSLSSGGLAQVYGFTDLDGTRPDCWRYLVEVQEAGLPANDTGYR